MHSMDTAHRRASQVLENLGQGWRDAPAGSRSELVRRGRHVRIKTAALVGEREGEKGPHLLRLPIVSERKSALTAHPLNLDHLDHLELETPCIYHLPCWIACSHN